MGRGHFPPPLPPTPLHPSRATLKTPRWNRVKQFNASKPPAGTEKNAFICNCLRNVRQAYCHSHKIIPQIIILQSIQRHRPELTGIVPILLENPDSRLEFSQDTSIPNVKISSQKPSTRRVRSYFEGWVHFKLERNLCQQSLKYISLYNTKGEAVSSEKTKNCFCVIRILNVILSDYYPLVYSRPGGSSSELVRQQQKRAPKARLLYGSLGKCFRGKFGNLACLSKMHFLRVVREN